MTSKTDATKLPGERLAGRYRYVRELGRGASGRVLLVADEAAGGALRAVKVVAPGEAARLAWECDALAAIAHPGLARVFELLRLETPVGAPFGLEAGATLLVEEHVEGRTALEALELLRTDDAEERVARVCAVGEAVARALAAVHAAGFVHGDVKPTNVLVPTGATEGPCARLVDLGVARAPGTTTTVSGSPAYLAPEAWLGIASARTDLFALGVTLVELLGAGPSHDAVPVGIAPALAALLVRLRAADADERPASAREVAAQLALLSASVAPPARAERGKPTGTRTAAWLGAAVSPAEAAMVLERLPLVGAEVALAALGEALGATGVVAVCGPRGAGRSRLVEEAMRRGQRAGVLAGERARTFVSVPSLPRVAPTYDAVWHVREASPADASRAAALVRAAAVDGTALAIVLEVSEAPREVRTVELAPLGRDGVRALLERASLALAALEGAATRGGRAAVTAAVVDAALAASGGLAGRLCRLLALACARGADPLRPATWRALLPDAGAGAWLAPDTDAARLAEALAVAGGALAATDAAAVLGARELHAAVRALETAGHATRGADARLLLREDVVRAVLGALSDARRRAIARTLLEASPRDAVVRALAQAASGAGDEAEATLLAGVAGLRRRGEPESVAALAEAVLHAFGPRPSLLAALADALRALARYADAEALLATCDDAVCVVLRAEIARLCGDADRARALAARGCDDTTAPEASRDAARALRARLALDARLRGALTADDPSWVVAMREASRIAARETRVPGAARARAAEVLALAALSRGEGREAAEWADVAMRSARIEGERGAEARATSLLATIAHARGDARTAALEAGRARELAEAAGEAHAAATFAVNAGLARLDLGELGPAIAALRDGARRLVAIGRDVDAARAAYNLANAAHLAGDDELARVALAQATSLGGADPVLRAHAALLRAEVARRREALVEAASALAAVRDADAHLPAALRAVLASRAAVIAAMNGDSAAASASLERARRAAADAEHDAARADVALAESAVALSGGDASRALSRAQAASALGREAPWEPRLRAAIALGDAAERAGDASTSLAAFADARALLDEAASSLPIAARAAFRAVSEHRRVLGRSDAPNAATSRATPASPDSTGDARWRRLAGLAKRLGSEQQPARLVDVVLDAALELSGAERALFVVREQDGALAVRGARGLVRRGGEGEAPGFSRSIAARVLDAATPLATVDASADGRLDAAASVHALALRSVVAVPLRAGDGAEGVLYLDDRLRAGAFGTADVALLVDLADLAALALATVESVRRERRSARRLERLRRTLAETVERQGVELVGLRRLGSGAPLAGLVGESEAMRRLAGLVERVAVADVPVLVLGESGVGKELVARAVHALSPRRERPFVSENCGAIPEPLLESTLFGHVRGAFTGADRARTGLFEAADGGTLLLDEIGEMSPAMQTKLLRVLQEGEVRAVGGERTRKVDVRVIAATHRDLEAMIRAGTFRQDLFYRLAVVSVPVPPLRQRPEDVAALVAYFVEKHARGRRVTVDRRALVLMQAYAWPGNVRQLENEVQRALLLASDVVGPEHLSPALSGVVRDGEADGASIDALDLRGQTDALERRLIRRALAEHGTRAAAARALGVSRFGLQKMMRRLALDRSEA
jgi:serine/threonine-protein kinase PknK